MHNNYCRLHIYKAKGVIIVRVGYKKNNNNSFNKIIIIIVANYID